MTSTWKQCHRALGLLLSLSIPAGAHVGDRIFPVYELTDEMLEEIRLDDGLVDEWMDLFGEPSMTLLDFKEENAQSVRDPSDLDFRIWLAWHDEPARFYVAFVASDDVYKNTYDYDERPGGMFWNDSIEVGIDGDHSGGVGLWHGKTQHYDAIARTVNGPTMFSYALWATLPPFGESGGDVFGERPTISAIELYVTPLDQFEERDSPEGNVISDLAAGRTIGFSIGVNDHDPPDETWKHWLPEFMHFDDPEPDFDIWEGVADRFFDGFLLSSRPGDSAVESVAWGRIKAALKVE